MKKIIIQAYKDAYEFMFPLAIWLLVGSAFALLYLTFGHINIFEKLEFEQ